MAQDEDKQNKKQNTENLRDEQHDHDINFFRRC
jgi:hypothetical protein